MENISVNTMANAEESEKYDGKRTSADIWKEVINQLVDPSNGMEEAERKAYEQKILRKMKSGKRLSSEELDYLRIHNPELYRTAQRIENARKALKCSLNNCKSKEEVQQVVSAQMGILRSMKNDPDREYMAAMIKKEISDFQKSSAYAKLPQEREKRENPVDKKQKQENFAEESLEEMYSKINVYVQTQFQCERIIQMTKGIA